jgi:hypothetical protein
MKALIVAAAVALGFTLAAPTPAQATIPSLYHISPDNGYNAPFSATCWGGGVRSIGVGQSDGCPNGVVAVYVYPGQEIVCWYNTGGGGYWAVWLDATGSHDVSGSSRGCVMQAD